MHQRSYAAKRISPNIGTTSAFRLIKDLDLWDRQTFGIVESALHRRSNQYEAFALINRLTIECFTKRTIRADPFNLLNPKIIVIDMKLLIQLNYVAGYLASARGHRRGKYGRHTQGCQKECGW